MTQKILASIPLCGINNCLSTSENSEEGIYDHPDTWCYFSDFPRNFTVYNPRKISFTMMAIDKCSLATNFVGRRCDFGILIEKQHFYLIEIKDTLKKTVDKSKSKWQVQNDKLKVRGQICNPIEQIENTIGHFINLDLFNGYLNKTAIVCWRADPPVPATTCAFNTARMRFFQKYGFLLLEGNSITI